MSAEYRSHCPVNFALEAIGDRWSLLILRDIIFRGKVTYNEFLSSEEGFATNILAARLIELQENGILKRSKDPSDGRKTRFRLTDKGFDLVPMIFEMILWSSKYDSKSEARHIKGLVDKIRKNNRKLSEEVIEQIRNGQSILSTYLEKQK